MIHRSLVCALVLTVAGCATDSVPRWQQEAAMASQRQIESYLLGQDRVYRAERALALASVAKSASIERRAELLLLECALRVSSLDLTPCEEFDSFAEKAPEVTQAQRAYRKYIYGESLSAQAQALLPAQHRQLVAASNPNAVLVSIKDPLSRLVAASVLMQRGSINASSVNLAVDTASTQGWPRPLAGWLTAQRNLAQRMGNTELFQQSQRRLELLSH